MIVNRLPIKDVLENLDTKLENETIKRMLRKMATKETRLRLSLTATVDLMCSFSSGVTLARALVARVSVDLGWVSWLGVSFCNFLFA